MINGEVDSECLTYVRLNFDVDWLSRLLFIPHKRKLCGYARHLKSLEDGVLF